MIDLKAEFGNRYRITLDPSAGVDTDRESRLWFYRIPCRYGLISIHGPETLAAYTDRRMVVGRLVAISGVRIHQRGDSEVRVLFAPDRLDEVADLLRARRRRRISEAERQRLAMIGRQNSPFLHRERVPAAPSDPEGGG